MFELVMRAPQSLVEAASDALTDELEALSVSVEDADAGGQAEQALFGEPGLPAPRTAWERSTLSALFESESAATEAAAWLLAQPWAAGLGLQALREVPEQDWVRLTQAQFAPVAITPRFWVVPSWHEVPAEATRVLRLDPGLAFGTGTHPTTRMCLRWIAGRAQALEARPGGAGEGDWGRVLDYGCGSGILAIGAALHGARDVWAVDIDPAAVQATRANAQANGAALQAGLPEVAPGGCDIVLANILATPLKLLAPLLSGLLQPAGTLVLAGILSRQTEEVAQAYAPWLSLRVADEEEGWVLLAGTRQSA